MVALLVLLLLLLPLEGVPCLRRDGAACVRSKASIVAVSGHGDWCH